MKTTITPAQITTVEDKIAGNLTFTQILFLIIPLLTATATYVLMSPGLQFKPLKLSLIILQFAIFLPLAIRIKGKTVADWLVIILRHKARPRIYIFTKNDSCNRLIIETATKETKAELLKVANKDMPAELSPPQDQNKVDELLKHSGVTVRLGKKGGIDVAVCEAEK